MSKKSRPKHLKLFQIHFPVTAVLSVGHRASGILLFLLTPVLIFLLDLSISNSQGFDEVKVILSGGIAKLIIFIVIWAVCHHLFAGIRYLMLDMGVGEEKPAARRSAWIVMFSAFVASMLVAWCWL